MYLPEQFAANMLTLLGDEGFRRLQEALDGEPSVSVRLNRAKCGAATVAGTQVPWCGDGFYISQRPAFTFDPLLHAGFYYVQEASSMFLHHALSEHVSGAVALLDLCAAPGGKTTTALGALPGGSVVMCNEPVRQRAQVLAENIAKWGAPNVVVTNSYPRDYARSGLAFDIILCDVPCSGEGMFRKDAEAVAGWSEAAVDSCCALQREIVADAWECLRPGGLMVYSTCTFNTREDEENVRWIAGRLGGQLLQVSTDSSWRIVPSLLPGFGGPVYRFLPGFTRGEGLFMAVIRKEGDAGPDRKPPAPRKRRAKGGTQGRCQHGAAAQAAGLLSCLRESDTFVPVTLTGGRELAALPAAMADMYARAERHLKILAAGVPLGLAKGHGYTPHPALALSTALAPGAFPRAELTYPQAVSYLRHEAITLPDGAPRGHVVVTWQGAPLGFVKNIGNRANNLFPQEWRIKSSHLPDSPPGIIRPYILTDSGTEAAQ